VIGLALTIVLLVAVIRVGVRRWQRVRADQQRPGATIHRAVTVSSFDEIDAAVQATECWCGGFFFPSGETSRTFGDRRFRVVRMVCNRCERDQFMYFDVTQVFN
jgi:hypothetical protein